MGQKVKHRKLLRRSGASCNGDVFSGLSNQEVCPAPYSASHAATLSQAELSQYLHRILTSNLPYYSALAHYRDRRNRASEGKARGDSTMWQKNLRLYFRLTESGLSLLKTQFAKKPKNPV